MDSVIFVIALIVVPFQHANFPLFQPLPLESMYAYLSKLQLVYHNEDN